MRKKNNWIVLLLIVAIGLSMGGCAQTKSPEPSASLPSTASSMASLPPTTQPATQTASAAPQLALALTLPIVKPGSYELTFAATDTPAQYGSLADGFPVWKKIEEITGIKIKWEVFPSTSYETTMKTRLAAAQDLPDIMAIPGTVGDAVQYAKEGLILPLSDLIQKNAPDIMALYEKYPDVKNSSTAPDGQIYFFITCVFGNNNSYLSIIRNDWLNELGLAVPETAEDWYNVLSMVKNSDMDKTGKGDIIPFGANIDFFMSAFNMVSAGSGIGNNCKYYWYDGEGKVSFFATRPDYKNYLAYLNKLYTAKLLDPMYGAGQSMVSDLFVQNKVFAIQGWAAEPVTWNSQLKTAGFNDADCLYVLPPKNEKGVRSYAILNRASYSTLIALSKDCKDPDIAIKFYDFIHASQEGTRIDMCGIEGEDWQLDSNGTLQFTQAALTDPKYDLIGHLRSKGAFLPNIVNNQTEEFNKARITGIFAQNLQTIQNDGGGLIYPSIISSQEEQQKITSLSPDIISYIDEMTVKFVTGQESLDNFDTFVQKLTSMGIEELTTVYQQQYDRSK